MSRTFCLLCLLTFIGAAYGADMKSKKGFNSEGDTLVLLQRNGEGLLETTKRYEPGYYWVKGEYKTSGIGSEGKFATDAKSLNWKEGLSNYEWNSPAPDWRPFVLAVRVQSTGPFMIRFGNWQGAKDGKISVRRMNVEAVNFKKGGENWLANGNWDLGTEGEIPAGWSIKSRGSKAADMCLVPNTSFRTGKNVLRLTSDGKSNPVLNYRCLPLARKGEIEFSAWFRSDVPDAHITMHIVCDSWNPRAQGGGGVNKTWKKITTKLTVPTEGNKKWFFVRLDARAKGSIEVADAKVVWHESGKTNEEGVEELWAGWQGVPGKNLILNPDMELGGIGYYYDFSWPKKYAHYESIRKNRPTLFLEGKGVDGGTAAFIQRGGMRAFCFPVTVGKTYTYSVDLRSPKGTTGEAMILSFDTEWRAALWKKVTNIPSDRWTRYSWTVNWKNHNIQKRGYVRVDSSTGILVDRLQVVEGREKNYQAPPVMLGLMTDRHAYFVRGRDAAKAKIKVVPGIKRAGKVTVEVVAKDAWGKVSWRKRFESSLTKTNLYPVDLPTDRLGTFHVDLKAYDGDKVVGIGIARYAIIDKPVLERTSRGKLGLFGICQESFNYPAWICEKHAQIHTDMGVRMNRLFASFPPDISLPLPKVFTDDLLAKCRPFSKAGIDVIPCVGLIPHKTGQAVANLKMPKQADLDTYGKWMHAYVSALQSEVKYWEIFNEPNLWRVSSGPDRGKRTMYPKKYFEFQKVAYSTIKKIDPDLQVMCNALNNLPEDWIEEWMKLGAGKYMDIFSFHPYGWTNFYPRSRKLREQLARHGFTKPIVNSEKYFASNIFYDRAGYEETRRGYYLPHHMELQTAGRSMRHFISHAADRVPYAPFAPQGTLFRMCPGDSVFVYDFFAAYNAATRFLVRSGQGEMVDLGPSMTAFVFPKAEHGPLAVIWTPLETVQASMKLNGTYQAYDIMGNPYPRDQRELRMASDPTYIQYPKGTDVDGIKQALRSADVIGLGAPFKIDLALTGAKRLTARVTSCRNKPLSGNVKLMALPKGWTPITQAKPFSDLQAGKTAEVHFEFTALPVNNLERYTVSFMAESGDDFVREEVILRPMFATKLSITADGDLSDWKTATWITLDEKRMSKDFNPEIKHRGASDLSGRVATAWTPDYFAVAAEITDDRFVTAQSERVVWEGDSIQIYFDPKNDASKTTGINTGEDVNYSIGLIRGKAVAWIDKGAQANYKGPANKAEAFHDADVRLSIKRVGNKTIYEMLFPRTKCIPAANLVANGNLGFSLIVNDNDGKGRKIGVTLAPKGREPYGAPWDYADVILKP